ncbi:hypothetical protein [Micavibrio aeruginosavorus]|uniref:hypothetical protein n=1 Tax=Micavibrio aeruginosavorus TaxID=349221 RepID=UPI003F4A9D04
MKNDLNALQAFLNVQAAVKKSDEVRAATKRLVPQISASCDGFMPLAFVALNLDNN